MQVNRIGNVNFEKKNVNNISKSLDKFNKQHILKSSICDNAQIYNKGLWKKISDSCLLGEKAPKVNNTNSYFQDILKALKKIF